MNVDWGQLNPGRVNWKEAGANIATVVKRELIGYFASPLAYVFIVIFLLLSGFLTFMAGQFFERGEASLAEPFFTWHPWLFMFLASAIGMGLWAEEQKSGTIELLFTMPIAPWHAILGKFLSAWAVLVLAVALTFPIVITVAFLGDPDMGPIVGGYIGVILLAGAFLAVAGMTSAMTTSQVISFIVSTVVCFFLILVGWPPVTDLVGKWMPGAGWMVDAVASMSVMTHLDSFEKGVIDLRDVLFFISVIGFCLFATAVILKERRSG